MPASGVLGFLADEEPELKVFALQTLNDDIDTLWTEVAGSVSQIILTHLATRSEALYEDESFPERQLASLVLAKVYYHLQAYNESMTFALGAGDLFQLDKEGEFEETIISKCVDTYITVSAQHHAAPQETKKDSALPTLATSFASGAGDSNAAAALTSPTTPFSQSTLPSKSLLSRASTDNMLEQPVVEGKGSSSTTLPDRSTQIALQKVIERLFESCLREGRYRQVVGIAVEARNLEVLRRVIKRASEDEKKSKSKQAEGTVGPTEELMEYVLDICMDIVQERGLRTEILRLILDLLNDIPTPDYFSIAKCVVYLNQDEEASTMLKKLVANNDQTSTATAYQIAFDLYDNGTQEFLAKVIKSLPSKAPEAPAAESADREPTESDQLLGELNDRAGASADEVSDEHIKIFDSIRKILDGSETIRLNLEFLYRNNHTDLSILNKVRDSLEGRNSIFHTAVTFCNAFMNQGTTNDKFFRDNLEWLGKAVNWSKFSATAALGVIHRGLGIAGMATGDQTIYENLRNVLYADSALNGEAVGLAMGLIMLGTGNIKALEDMITYAHDTQHEKSVRGLAIGMALIMYGRQEGADELIEGLLNDPDPTLRYGGIMTVALAYCGTGSNKAVRKLLHVAVSDVNDDVRRIAVMSLGFILFRKPGSVPRMVELLSESYNPHVRYGAAMALGISCAGTGLDEAIDLLEPMMKDPTDFVRQGALISLAMIMVQQNEVMNPKVAEIRKTLKKIVADRHEDAMTKFGCALALGIIDAGGRNCTIGLQTQTGNLNMAGIVGMAVFTQYWYWFPFTHFLSLSFTPTSMIGLNHELEIPSFKFHSATRPSLFDYPPEQEVKTEDAPTLIATAVLSTTAQAKRRAQKKERAQRRESMDIDQTPATPKVSAPADDKMDVDESAKDKEEKAGEKKDEAEKDSPAETLKKKFEKEKVGYEIENMSRVLPAQLKYISFPAGRYKPVKKPTGGVVLMIDTQPEEEKVLIEEKLKKASIEKAAAPTTLEDMRNESFNLRRQADAQGEAAGALSGAAAAAGVLTAVDEDEEGAEEATLPGEFEYFTDGEDE
ncbi:proteasome cyclosome protein [Rutstroemia sp. NJR-2017a BVV2]|nr:proteasome cyclosome protein [Rutstroemia sp. NJR-2017a BVV2]